VVRGDPVRAGRRAAGHTLGSGRRWYEEKLVASFT